MNEQDFAIDKLQDGTFRVTRIDIEGDYHTHMKSKQLAKTVIYNVCNGKIPLNTRNYTLISMYRLSNNEEYRDKIQEINSALVRLINLEGERSVVERLRDAGEEIIEDVIVAAIGYNESSSRAAQSILNVLLPSSIKNRAMAMGDVADIADDFEDFEE